MINKKVLSEGWHVGSQTPIDDRLVFADLAALQNMGVGNVNAYRYYEGMTVFVVAEGTSYRWLESATGALPLSITYPANIIVNGIDYSNRTFNFVPVSGGTVSFDTSAPTFSYTTFYPDLPRLVNTLYISSFNSSLWAWNGVSYNPIPTAWYVLGTTTDAGGSKINNISRTGSITVGADSYFNTIRVGLGAGNIATNTAVGLLSLDSNTSGANNTAIGRQALRLNTTGLYNMAVGTSALVTNTTGSYNAAIGTSSLGNNISGNYNVAIGSGALSSNTTSSQMVAVGYNALYNNIGGDGNTAIGNRTLENNISGYANTAVGYDALRSNDATNNTAVGRIALSSNTSGENNTAIGSEALTINVSGSNNSGVGYRAGSFLANGFTANATGFNSVFIGANTKALSASNENQIVIGYNAIGAGSNTVQLGNTSITDTYIQGIPHINNTYTLPITAPTVDQVLGYSSPGISAWITGSGSLAGNVLFVSSAGSDTDVTRAGHLGDTKKPFRTLQAARNAAISGDLIYVFPQTFIFDNTGGAYNSNLEDLNMWKDGITYYWSPGTKVQISNVISSTLNTIYFFKPSGLAFETCTSIGHLEYTQTTTGGPPAFGAIFYFYDANITSGYTFYSQTKSQIGYSNEIINVQRDLVSSANITTVTIISDYEKVIHSPQMQGTGAGNYVSGGDNTLIFNSYVRERYYGTLYALGCRYNFTKSTVNFFGETMYVTCGSGEFNSKIMDLRYAYGTINVDIKKTTLFESSSNTNASGIYARSGNDGAVGGITLNYKGDITETSTTGSAFALFRIDSASNTINYDGNITMSPSNAGRVVVSVSNNSKVNITGNIIYNGVSPSTSTIFATSGTAQLKYIGNISGNFANNIAQCGTGTVEINNSNIKSTVAGAGSYFFSNGGTSLGTIKINNSYIELNNSTNPSANGAYVKALINNSTLISSGASAGIANSTNFGLLQAVNSMIYATSLPVNYTGTAAVTVASASTNTAWTVATPILGGTLDIIPSLTF